MDTKKSSRDGQNSNGISVNFGKPLNVHGIVFGIPVRSLIPNTEQIRYEHFMNTKKFDELCESIKELGILAPPIVEHNGRGQYQIVCGHRRYFAAVKVGLHTVPCLIQNEDLSQTERVRIMLVENLQREELSPLEQADAFARLLELGFTQKEIATKVGKSKYYVNKALAFRKRLTADEWEKLKKVATSQHMDFSRLEEASKINEPELRQKALFSDIPVCEIRSLRKGLSRRTRPKREEPRKYRTRLKEDALSALLEISGELRSREDVMSISQKLVEQFCHEHQL